MSGLLLHESTKSCSGQTFVIRMSLSPLPYQIRYFYFMQQILDRKRNLIFHKVKVHLLK